MLRAALPQFWQLRIISSGAAANPNIDYWEKKKKKKNNPIACAKPQIAARVFV